VNLGKGALLPALGVLGSLQAALCGSCQSVANSPIEDEGRVETVAAMNPEEDCWASTHPILALVSMVSSDSSTPLFALRPDGSDARLVANVGAYAMAVWAPDGYSIAFRRQRVVAVDTIVPTDLGMLTPKLPRSDEVLLLNETDLSASAGSRSATWSPTGQTLAFASRRDGEHYAIYVMSRLGGEPRLLLPDLAASQFDPSWAPEDERRLAFVTEVDGVQDIWVVNPLNVAERENLTLGRVRAPALPRWSPDGTAVAFSAGDPAEADGQPDIYIWRASSSELTRVTDDPGEDIHPIWAPDGESLLISSSRDIIDPDTGTVLQRVDRTRTLWQVPLNGSAPPRWLTLELGDSAATDWYPARTCGSAEP
jgi:Tol biopolymer transport system component